MLSLDKRTRLRDVAMSLRALADQLDFCERQGGAGEDEPEGARYITISDTFALGFAKALRAASAAVEEG